MAKPEASTSGYRIGTVSKLTGISPDTLRIWERRYEVVTPERSSGGGRLYTTGDIARLKLIRRLVDKGDAIGVVAGLSHEELQARLAETTSVAAIAAPSTPPRLVVIGELLMLKLEAEKESLPDITVVASYDTLQAFQAEANVIEADVLIIAHVTGRNRYSGGRLDNACQCNTRRRVLSIRHAGNPGKAAALQVQYFACTG